LYRRDSSLTFCPFWKIVRKNVFVLFEATCFANVAFRESRVHSAARRDAAPFGAVTPPLFSQVGHGVCNPGVVHAHSGGAKSHERSTRNRGGLVSANRLRRPRGGLQLERRRVGTGVLRHASGRGAKPVFLRRRAGHPGVLRDWRTRVELLQAVRAGKVRHEAHGKRRVFREFGCARRKRKLRGGAASVEAGAGDAGA